MRAIYYIYGCFCEVGGLFAGVLGKNPNFGSIMGPLFFGNSLLSLVRVLAIGARKTT